jgi:hypothetical protein
MEFPPLLGGTQSKSQFDDFDNIQELDANRDWAIPFASSFTQSHKTWILFGDTQECTLAKQEWVGQRYRSLTFTTLEAVTRYCSDTYEPPWGATILSNPFLSWMSPNASSMGDTSTLDPLQDAPSLCIVVQPGNGGPVDDWIHCEKIAQSNLFQSSKTTLVIVNGALDKVRDGFYPALFFPKLAATVQGFYNKFESALYLRPVSDKGVYGWIFRVYPEPWQVILQSKEYGKNGDLKIVDRVVYTSEKRPSYQEAVLYLVAASKSDLR